MRDDAGPSILLRSLAAGMLAGLLAGCGGPASPGATSGATAPPSGEPATEVAASASCTAEWRARGGSQAEAKAFAAECLRRSGGVERTLSAAEVDRLLVPLVTPGSELARLVPADVAAFCPDYAAASPDGRAAFWRALIAAMVPPESARKTATAYWEGGTLQQFSIGLLQLSLTDAAGYGCSFRTEAEITDPEANLACGVRIVTARVRRSSRIGGDAAHPSAGAAAYWSTLRVTSPARAQIIAATSALPACGG